MATSHVYFMRISTEEDRPWLDFERPENGKNVPWGVVGAALEGHTPSSQYVPIRFRVYEDGAEDWHHYMVPGTFGLFSKKAIDLIGAHMKQCFEFVEAFINDSPFFFPRQIGTLDCLDREHSKLVPYPEDPEDPDEPAEPDELMEIEQYVFQKKKIPDPSVFVIPETLSELFATQSIKQIVEEAKLNGIVFLDAEEMHR